MKIKTFGIIAARNRLCEGKTIRRLDGNRTVEFLKMRNNNTEIWFKSIIDGKEDNRWYKACYYKPTDLYWLYHNCRFANFNLK